MTEFKIAAQGHLEEIVSIYNWAIQNTSATFDTEIKTVEDQRPWFDAHNEKYPLIVAIQEQRVVGWGSISSWSDRCAYSGTGEVSFYVHPDFHGKGIGSELLKDLIKRGKANKFRTLLSRITGESDASIHLHKKFGFEMIGTMKNVGEKFNKIHDVHMMQILFN